VHHWWCGYKHLFKEVIGKHITLMCLTCHIAWHKRNKKRWFALGEKRFTKLMKGMIMSTNEVNVSDLTLNLGSYDTAMKRLERRTLPSGEYSLRMKSWKALSGDKGIRVQFVLEAFDCEDPEDNDVAVFHSTPISGKGEIFFLQTIKAYGGVWEGESVHLVELLNSLVGTSAKAQIDQVPAQKREMDGTLSSLTDEEGNPVFNNNVKRWIA